MDAPYTAGTVVAIRADLNHPPARITVDLAVRTPEGAQYAFVIMDEKGWTVRATPDGRVEMRHDIALDEQTLLFWRTLARALPEGWLR